jgi:hypothetical protein
MPRRTVSVVQIALLLLLAGLVAFLTLQRGKQKGPDSAQQRPARAFDSSKVREVSFQRRNVFVRVAREADGFWIVEPYRDRADDRFIAQAIEVAATFAPLRSLPDTAGGLFGLTPPGAVWICRWEGGSYEIALGDSLPAGGGRFARAGESRQVLVIDSFLARRYLSPPVVELHNPMAAQLEIGPIDSALIETREEVLTVVRHRADFWEFVRPLHVEGSAAQLARAVEALRSDGLTEFLGPADGLDLKTLGLDPPRATWTLVQGKRRQSVRIGHPTTDETSVRVIPAGRDVVALISSENFRQWVDGISRLRETLLLSTPPDSVTRVEVDGPGGRRVFVRPISGAWRETASAETLAVRSGALALMVQNTCQVRAAGFREGASPAKFPEEIRLCFRRMSGTTDTLRIGAPRGGVSLAWSRRQPGTCEISGDPYRAWSIWLNRPLRP